MEIKVSIKFQFEKIGEEIKVSMKPKTGFLKFHKMKELKGHSKKDPSIKLLYD